MESSVSDRVRVLGAATQRNRVVEFEANETLCWKAAAPPAAAVAADDDDDDDGDGAGGAVKRSMPA